MQSTATNEYDDFKNAQIISNNLQRLLAHNHLSEIQLSKNTGINFSTVRRLVAGVTPDPRISTLMVLCEYFKISLDDLLSDAFTVTDFRAPKTKSYLVPILTWQNLADYASKRISYQNWLPITLYCDEDKDRDLFAVESTHSMQAKFPEGTILIIDKNELAFDGDMIIVVIKDQKSATIRYLSIDGANRVLLPIISSSAPLEFDANNHEILGTVILTQNHIK